MNDQPQNEPTGDGFPVIDTESEGVVRRVRAPKKQGLSWGIIGLGVGVRGCGFGCRSYSHASRRQAGVTFCEG